MFSKKLSNKSYSFQGKYIEKRGYRTKENSKLQFTIFNFPRLQDKSVGIYHLDTKNVATNATFIKAFAFNSL